MLKFERLTRRVRGDIHYPAVQGGHQVAVEVVVEVVVGVTEGRIVVVVMERWGVKWFQGH